MIERKTDLTPLPTAHPNRRSVLALLAASLLYPPGRAAAIGTTERLRLRIAVNGNFSRSPQSTMPEHSAVC